MKKLLIPQKIGAIIIEVLLTLSILSLILLLNFKSTCLKNIFIGLFTSFVSVLLIEIVKAVYSLNRLSKLTGTYERIKITKIENGQYIDLDYKTVKSIIKLKYRGEGEYSGTAFYEEGEVKCSIILDFKNPKIGTGIYQYLFKDQSTNEHDLDLGTYNIQLDMKSTKIIVFYSNSLPSGNACGYEIWEKQNL